MFKQILAAIAVLGTMGSAAMADDFFTRVNDRGSAFTHVNTDDFRIVYSWQADHFRYITSSDRVFYDSLDELLEDQPLVVLPEDAYMFLMDQAALDADGVAPVAVMPTGFNLVDTWITVIELKYDEVMELWNDGITLSDEDRTAFINSYLLSVLILENLGVEAAREQIRIFVTLYYEAVS